MNNGLLGSLATYPSLGMMSHKMYLPSIDDRWKYTYMPDIEEDKQKKENMEVSLDCTSCETKSENTMKYGLGDEVRIKGELNTIHVTEKGDTLAVTPEMYRMKGETHIITAVNKIDATYTLNGNSYLWAADMLEPVDEKECHKEMISKWWKTVSMKMETPSEENGKLTIPQIEPTFKFI